MVKYETKRTQETVLDGPFIKNTGRTRIVTSYTTFNEMASHKKTPNTEFLGTDTSYAGTPPNRPIIVYRVFEVTKKEVKEVKKRRTRKKKSKDSGIGTLW
jgi:hypothetical protein